MLNALSFRKKTINKKKFNLNEQKQLENVIDLIANELAFVLKTDDNQLKQLIKSKLEI